MSIETPTEVEVDLDAFADELFTGKAPEPKTETEVAPSTPDVTEEKEPEEDDLEEADLEEEGEEEAEAEPDPEPKPVKKTAKDRIRELNAKLRETERRLAEKEAAQVPKQEPKPEPTPVVVPDVPAGPQPDELNADGTEKYPLGVFDPSYISDLTRHTLIVERQQLLAREAREAEQNKVVAARQQLQSEWNQKLDPARERYPDFQEKSETLINSFSGLDPNYGEYLSTTLMSMDYGTDVLYYLSNNPDEAKRIINLGARKATLALGRIENKFVEEAAEKARARPRVSKAPEPPKVINKGATATLPDDEDDLDIFAAKLFDTRARR